MSPPGVEIYDRERRWEAAPWTATDVARPCEQANDCRALRLADCYSGQAKDGRTGARPNHDDKKREKAAAE